MTKHEILVNKFRLFCKVYGLRDTPEITESNPAIVYKDKWIVLDRYQGYRLEIINSKGGSHYFDGKAGRMTASEMICYLDGLLAAATPTNFTGIKLQP